MHTHTHTHTCTHTHAHTLAHTHTHTHTRTHTHAHTHVQYECTLSHTLTQSDKIGSYTLFIIHINTHVRRTTLKDGKWKQNHQVAQNSTTVTFPLPSVTGDPCTTRQIHMCDTTLSHVWYGWITCAQCLIHVTSHEPRSLQAGVYISCDLDLLLSFVSSLFFFPCSLSVSCSLSVAPNKKKSYTLAHYTHTAENITCQVH